MKMWIVSRRTPLRRAKRTVEIWRDVVMALTAEEAIATSKGNVPNPSAEYFEDFLSGTWSAAELSPPYRVSLGAHYDDPTSEEVVERDKRVIAADIRRKRKSHAS